MSAPRGVSALGGVSAPMGVCLGVCVCLGGVCSGGVSAPGGVVSQHALRWNPHPPCGQTDACKNITFATSLRTVNMDITCLHSRQFLNGHATAREFMCIDARRIKSTNSRAR